MNTIPENSIFIQDSTFSTLSELSKNSEGIVLLGAGGELTEWITGVSDILKKEGVTDGDVKDNFSEFHKLTTSGGRTDLLMLFSNTHKLNIGKMAMWRLRFGDCSWLSDYVVNYRDQHNGTSN